MPEKLAQSVESKDDAKVVGLLDKVERDVVNGDASMQEHEGLGGKTRGLAVAESQRLFSCDPPLAHPDSHVDFQVAIGHLSSISDKSSEMQEWMTK